MSDFANKLRMASDAIKVAEEKVKKQKEELNSKAKELSPLVENIIYTYLEVRFKKRAKKIRIKRNGNEWKADSGIIVVCDLHVTLNLNHFNDLEKFYFTVNIWGNSHGVRYKEAEKDIKLIEEELQFLLN